MNINKELDKLLSVYLKEKEEAGIKGEELGKEANTFFKLLQKRFYESALQGEMEHHLGYAKHEKSSEVKERNNKRNGVSKKKLITDNGELEIEVPRDRNGSFSPDLIPKHQRRLPDFDEKVLYFYAQGLSQREIARQLEELYHTEVSQELISRVTDAVNQDVLEWRNHPLDEVYPIVYLDALVIKLRSEGKVSNHSVYLALGINLEGKKEVLGAWVSQNEGAKFWLQVLNELHSRGLKDILIACVDGLNGFGEAINSVYPLCDVQGCIVHAVRNALKFVNWKQRRQVAGDLKLIYQSPTREVAREELERFKEKWDGVYPIISQQWENNWERFSVFFNYPGEIRRAIYTTNAIESLNHSLRKVLKNKKAFPSEEALMKCLYLSIEQISKRWGNPIKDWRGALAYFKISFGDRLPDVSKIDISVSKR